MSMPQPFSIVISCELGPTSILAASAISNVWDIKIRGGIQPSVYASTWFHNKKLESKILYDLGRMGRNLIQTFPYYLIDPRSIHLWLTIGKDIDQAVQRHIITDGPAPDGYYRNIFPEPAMNLGVPIPPFPNKKRMFRSYFDELETSLKPWRDRLLVSFYNSS